MSRSIRSSIRTPTSPGKLRIIGGRLRGSRLAVPDRQGLRPTPDRVRETLFNWLTGAIEGARCLDLYAGTGALGIEALSRGAATCTFVERERELARALQANLDRLGANVGAMVACADAIVFLRGVSKTFDIAFLDPPFSTGGWEKAAAQLETQGWLSATAFIYIESPEGIAAPSLPVNWHIHREGRAGGVRFVLYRRDAADPLS